VGSVTPSAGARSRYAGRDLSHVEHVEQAVLNDLTEVVDRSVSPG